MLKPNWETNAFVQQYFNRNRLGSRAAYAPLLVIGSDFEPLIHETTKVVSLLCRQKDRVHVEKYSEADPGQVIGDSVRDQIAWIDARFAGRVATSNCSAPH
jgi:hypothetical protein